MDYRPQAIEILSALSENPFLSFNMNSATYKMFINTVSQYDEVSADNEEEMTNPDNMNAGNFWYNMMNDFAEEYDADWYALVATPAIEGTIDWNMIERKYCERRAVWSAIQEGQIAIKA